MSSKQNPNILFVFSDQQRYSALGANGNQIVQTPAIDRLAEEGTAGQHDHIGLLHRDEDVLSRTCLFPSALASKDRGCWRRFQAEKEMASIIYNAYSMKPLANGP